MYIFPGALRHVTGGAAAIELDRDPDSVLHKRNIYIYIYICVFCLFVPRGGRSSCSHGVE